MRGEGGGAFEMKKGESLSEGEKNSSTLRLGTAGLRSQPRAEGGVAPLLRNQGGVGWQ